MDDCPKESAKRGLAAITEEHRRGWEGGTVSYEAIAKEVRVKKQSVWAYAQRHGWERKPAPAEPPRPAPPPAPRRLQAADAEEAERDRIALIEANRAILWGSLQTLKGPLDVISRQRVQATLRGVAEQLIGLGHFGPLYEQEQQRIPELVIRRLTPQEEIEIQRRAEEENAWSNGHQVDEERRSDLARVAATHGTDMKNGDHPTPTIRPSIDGQKAGNSYGGRDGNSCGGRLGNSEEGSAPSSPGDDHEPKQMHELPRFSLPADSGLPDRDGFRGWLAALADRHGRATLQEIIKALGGTDPVAYDSRDREFLIAQILRLTGSDPNKLTPFVTD